MVYNFFLTLSCDMLVAKKKKTPALAAERIEHQKPEKLTEIFENANFENSDV